MKTCAMAMMLFLLAGMSCEVRAASVLVSSTDNYSESKPFGFQKTEPLYPPVIQPDPARPRLKNSVRAEGFSVPKKKWEGQFYVEPSHQSIGVKFYFDRR